MEAHEDAVPEGAFERSRMQFEGIVAGVADPRTDVVNHAELEKRLTGQIRELMQSLLQDHLDLPRGE